MQSIQGRPRVSDFVLDFTEATKLRIANAQHDFVITALRHFGRRQEECWVQGGEGVNTLIFRLNRAITVQVWK